MSDSYVHPILKKGSLICPQCGEGRMPTNRTRCWHCGVRFEAPFAAPPNAQIPKEEETPQPIKTSSISPVEKSKMIDGAKAASDGRNYWRNSWPTVILKINLILAIISGILAFFPMCTWEESSKPYRFISDMDGFTQALSYISALLSPILLGIASGSEDLWDEYKTLFCARLTQCFLGAGLLSTYFSFYNKYCTNDDYSYRLFSATAFFWFCIIFTVLGVILTSVVISKAKASRT